ncbi:MAG: hypothetical protein J6K03_03080 [Oscillospiraceae bacterium]|nr:hypothetical protein [Oscillospiraceae bacterium]
MRKKILHALLALVVSLGLWLYVITVENPNSENTFYNIPVVLDNESVLNDRGLMILTEKDPVVTLKLGGNRSYLNKLSNSNITLVADLARIYEAGEQTLAYSISYPGDIPQNSIEVLSQLPAQITLTIAERLTQSVPVSVVYTGQVPEGFMTDKENLTLDTKAVNITGPASVVKQIVEARITVDLDDQTETISQTYTYTLYDKNGEIVDDDMLTADVSEVKLTLKIQRYKEIALRLDVIPGGGATLENSSIVMDTESLLISGSEQLLESLGDAILLDTVNLGELTEDTALTYNIADLLPEGITNVSGIEKVNVTIQFPELKMRTLQVTQILPQNVPTGMHAEILTKELAVTLRGPAAVIDSLTADQIQALVDFSNAELGTDTYKVTFRISGAEGVGAVNSYTVPATISMIVPAFA